MNRSTTKKEDKPKPKRVAALYYGISPFLNPGEKPQTVKQIIANQ